VYHIVGGGQTLQHAIMRQAGVGTPSQKARTRRPKGR